MPRPVDLPTPSARPSLEVSHRDCGDAVCVVTPAGEIDLATAPLLKSSLVGLLGDGYTRFVVDLAAVRYLDSTGLGVLIGFARRLSVDGVVALAQLPGPVSALLEITGLDATFDVFVTVGDALAHIRGGRRPVAPPLSSDAAILVGLAATALPFAESTADELRRWIRILSLQGEAGRALRGVGLTDGEPGLPVTGDGDRVAPEGHMDSDSMSRVRAAATAIAADREAATVSTVDLLLAVMLVYGDTFDHELRVHGTSSTELIECLGTSPDPAPIS
jgi:anti-sigma B factor antagonist